jgi:hypothetical protein
MDEILKRKGPIIDPFLFCSTIMFNLSWFNYNLRGCSDHNISIGVGFMGNDGGPLLCRAHLRGSRKHDFTSLNVLDPDSAVRAFETASTL